MSYEDDYEETVVDAEQTPKGTITITLDTDRWLDGSLENIVVNSLVGKLATLLQKEVRATVEAKVLELADAKFGELAEEHLEEYFVRALAKTNTYGEATGTTITLREMLVDKFDKYLNERVDSKGARTTYRDDKLTRVQWMLNKLGHEPLQQAVNQTVKGIADKAREQIQASVSRYIAEQLTPTIDVPKLSS